MSCAMSFRHTGLIRVSRLNYWMCLGRRHIVVTFHQRVRTCSSYRWPLWYLCGDIEDDGYVEWYLRYNWSSFLSKYYKSCMWETEIVENCGNVALTIASCFIFSELRESLSSVFNLCSWTWSRKKCVSTVHRDEWVRMEVWDEMCNLDRACCSDASVCENRRIHMWVLLNVTVTEWFDIRTVIWHTDCDRYSVPSKVSHSLPAMVERLVLNLNMCLSFRDEDCMCSRCCRRHMLIEIRIKSSEVPLCVDTIWSHVSLDLVQHA